MKIEPCEWECARKHHGRRPSPLRVALLALEVGECRMVHHGDVACRCNGCSISNLVSRLNTNGRRYESYHESPHVAVVRRVA